MNLDLGSSRTLLWPTMAGAIVFGVLLLLLFAALTGGHDDEPGEDEADGGAASQVAVGSVLLFRHALTDRTQTDADPQARGGCDQQRNLSPDGTAQAERIGEGLAELPITTVYASPFCRTLDTAAAFDVGQVVVADQLISTTAGLDASAQQSIIDGALALISQELGGDDVVAMVTHTQNVEAMTGLTVDEGDAVVLLPSAGGADARPGGFDVGPVIRADDW